MPAKTFLVRSQAALQVILRQSCDETNPTQARNPAGGSRALVSPSPSQPQALSPRAFSHPHEAGACPRHMGWISISSSSPSCTQGRATHGPRGQLGTVPTAPCCSRGVTLEQEPLGHPARSLEEARRSPEPCDPVTAWERAAAPYKHRRARCASTEPPRGATSRDRGARGP